MQLGGVAQHAGEPHALAEPKKIGSPVEDLVGVDALLLELQPVDLLGAPEHARPEVAQVGCCRADVHKAYGSGAG